MSLTLRKEKRKKKRFLCINYEGWHCSSAVAIMKLS